MSVITQPMLEFSELKTPADHGDVLVAPEPAAWIKAAHANGESLRRADVPLLDSTLSACRRRTRKAIVGRDDTLVFLIGHQPSFVHPGVWAKHIVAMRVAGAADGIALHLVVDNDALKQTMLPIPSVQNERVILRSVPFARVPSGHAYEQIPRRTPDEIGRFERAVRDAMGDRYDDSQMPTFCGAFSGAVEARDWVDQTVAARRAVEASFGVVVDDRRVSDVWRGPFVVDLLVHADRFAASYNHALEGYRREHRVRGAQRPIPDLFRSEDRCEVAVWAYRDNEPRRRLFVARAGNALRFFADHEEIGVIPIGRLNSSDSLATALTELGDWRLRPRALMLTIWARLLLADLLIHGIGGAKYDRISDAIIADYYGVDPPHLACVSATLFMDLPVSAVTPEAVRRLRHAVRDLRFNPQRNLPGGADLDSLIEQRAGALRRAADLRASDRHNRQARRQAFNQIRDINAAMLSARPEALAAGQDELTKALRELEQNRIARGREYFFGLYDRERLAQLAEALPTKRDFRV